MKIAIIGSGNMGSAFAKRLSASGHDITIESTGFEAIDAGPLQNARSLEPMGMLNIWFGYTAKRGTGIAPAWLTPA